MQALGACIDERRTYYGKVLNDTSSTGLPAYLFNLYTPALEHDIEFILSNRFLRDENARFMAEFYVGGLVNYLARRSARHADEPVFADMGPFANLIHSALAEEITRQQQGRMR